MWSMTNSNDCLHVYAGMQSGDIYEFYSEINEWYEVLCGIYPVEGIPTGI